MVESIDGPVPAALMLMVRFSLDSAFAPKAGANDSSAAASEPASTMVHARRAGIDGLDGMEGMAFLL
ncbi:hypothetical protein ACIP9X_01905 [Arthrobacter sp. NPDC093125]|uniref:hypothetical protein n=1 Tax=Arthrobacter sp. NPDC093125 TaxID=3363944 RepID=UPI00380848FB